jgi:Rrf2 family iron-sulfur cluster assembly transcriptional regulator
MILTTKARYATTAIIDMVEMGGNNPISLLKIANRQNISLSYLEQIFYQLKKSGVVNSSKGPGGGYFLLKDTKDINVADIVLAIGEPVKMTKCSDRGLRCGVDGVKCKTHDLWLGLEDHIYSYLRSVSLADICSTSLSESVNLNLVANEG